MAGRLNPSLKEPWIQALPPNHWDTVPAGVNPYKAFVMERRGTE